MLQSLNLIRDLLLQNSPGMLSLFSFQEKEVIGKSLYETIVPNLKLPQKFKKAFTRR